MSGSLAQCSTAALLPGCWPWFPTRLAVLVRNDQVANLPP